MTNPPASPAPAMPRLWYTQKKKSIKVPLRSPDVAFRLNNLGMVLQDAGDLAGAKAHYERALDIWWRFLGKEHPHTRIARNNLAGVLAEMEKT